MKTISVVVPVYYNAGSLGQLAARLAQVEAELRALDLGLQLIFVDDGSGDASLDELLKIKQARPETVVVKLTRNFGADPACKCGLGFVTGDCFVILAADLQDPPELIPDLARRWLAGSRFVICEREEREDPPVSMFFSAVYYRLLRLLVMPDYPSGGYDLGLFDRMFLPHMRDAVKGASTTLTAYWVGVQPEVVRYARGKRVHGESRWTFSKKLAAFVDDMLGFSTKPLRLMSLFGLVVAGGSFLYGLMVVAYALAGERELPGFASIVTLVSGLLGVVILMLGLIGEYLSRILSLMNRRPDAVIDRVYEALPGRSDKG